MIKISATIASLLLLYCFHINAQNLKGNGNVIEKTYEVAPFSQLTIDGVFNTSIMQANENTVTVETDENLMHFIEIVEKDNKLIVQSNKKMNLKKSTKMHVYITLKDVNEIAVKGVGNVACETPLDIAQLKVEVSNVGNTSMNFKCEQLTANFSSVGNIELEGNATHADLEISGTGNVNAIDFIVENLSVENSSIGNVKVYAENTLEINSTGIGNVHYKGDATLKNFNVSGIGKVKKM